MRFGVNAVRHCAAIYNPYFQGWSHYWDGSHPDGICASLIDDYLVFRGSITAHDWLADFCARPVTPKYHPALGLVHEGFDDGMDQFFDKTVQFLPAHLNIAGHSLGAARAWLYAGRLIAAGRVPNSISVFGSPRPGTQTLKDLIKTAPNILSCKNGCDPVTSVPLWLPHFPFVDMAPFTMFNEVPYDEGLLRDHHIDLYMRGVKKLEA